MPTFQIQLAVTIDDDSAKVLAELIKPAFPQNRNDSGGSKQSDDQTLLIDSRHVAKMLKLSGRTIWKMQNNGDMPPPIRIGTSVRWRIEDLKKWVSDGCPARAGQWY